MDPKFRCDRDCKGFAFRKNEHASNDIAFCSCQSTIAQVLYLVHTYCAGVLKFDKFISEYITIFNTLRQASAY